MVFQKHQCRITYRKFRTESLVALSIALRDGDGSVIVVMVENIVGHVSHMTQSTAAVEQVLKLGFNTRPDFDTCAVAGIGHGDIVNIEILHYICLPLILTKRPDTNAMRARTVQVLDYDVGTIRFERDTVFPISKISRCTSFLKEDPPFS